MLEALQYDDAALMEQEDLEFSVPATPSTALTDTRRVAFEPHNLDSICRAVKSLGDPNIVLNLQTGELA